MARKIHQLVALVGLLALLIGLMPPRIARATVGPLTNDEAIKLLQSYDIVRGDPSGALNLDQRLTRAQAATIFVRAVGAEAQAKALASQVPFTDAVGHWAAGEIALANNLGLMRGDGNGTFRPESDITYAEVLTVLLRIVKREPTGPWDSNRIMLTAVELGIAPAGSQHNLPALRGKIFWALATAVSQIEITPGVTTLQKFVDSAPPQLTVNQTPTTTSGSSVTVTGKAVGAASVLVGGTPATLNQQTGTFTATVSAAIGENQITVEAVDYAGNKATSTVVVHRQPGVSRIDITGPSVIRAGVSTKINVQVIDNQNLPVPLELLDVQLAGDVATFDKTKSTLVAGAKIGRGTVTLSSGSVRKSFSFAVTAPSPNATGLVIDQINGGNAPLPGQEATVKVQVTDASGKLLTDDYWRTVTLEDSGLTGVTVKPSSAMTEAGVATFTITGTQAGETDLEARSSGLTEAESVLQFLPAPRIALTASADTLRADGTSTVTVRAAFVDENGRPKVNSSNQDIRIILTNTGADAAFTDDTVVIRSGASSSTDNAILRAGVRGGTLKISGTYDSSHSYPIQALRVTVTGDLGGEKMQIVGPSTTITPGRTTSLSVRVLDGSGNLVRTGSYAFQVLVTTSNNEPIVNCLPEGVTLTFPGTDLRPMDDGKRDGQSDNDATAIVGRTYQGVADLRLTYDKSGIVTVTPKVLGAVDEAYHPSLGFGPATSSSDMEKFPAQISFVGAPAGLKIMVDSDLGNDLPGGAVNTAETIKVAVQVVDADGMVIPRYSGTITLTRSASGDNVTRFSSTTSDRASKSTTTGQAVFDLQSVSTEGYDVYTAAVSGLPSATTTISVRKTKAQVPDIVGVYGIQEENLTPVSGKIAPNDDFMEILLANQVPPGNGEPTYWVSASVYRKGETAPILTNVPVDLNASEPVIRVPKNKLIRAGTATYQVTINNGAGDTQRSPDEGRSTAVNSLYSTSYKLSSGLFDAATGKLTLTTSGLATTGIVDPDRLRIIKSTNVVRLSQLSVKVVSVSSSTVVLQSDDLAAALDPKVFNGSVTIGADDGWYTSSDGSQVARSAVDAQLKPMGYITHATLDLSGTTKRLLLHGYGFDQGTLNLAAIKIGGVALRPGSSSTYDQEGTKTSTQVSISLSKTTLDAINALEGEIKVSAESGWLRVGTGATAHSSAAIEGDTQRLYLKVSISSTPYNAAANILTFRGSGFTGGTLDPQKLIFRTDGSATRRLDQDATAITVDDDTMEIHLSDSDATYFESSSGYRGKTVFINADEGWFQNTHGQLAAPLTGNAIRFVPQS